jgi:hypothetical protein
MVIICTYQHFLFQGPSKIYQKWYFGMHTIWQPCWRTKASFCDVSERKLAILYFRRFGVKYVNWSCTDWAENRKEPFKQDCLASRATWRQLTIEKRLPKSGLPDGTSSEQKFPIWVNFGGSCNGRCRNMFYLDIWSILRLFDIFYVKLIYFVVIWYIFPLFGMSYQEKSGNHASESHVRLMVRGPSIVAYLSLRVGLGL